MKSLQKDMEELKESMNMMSSEIASLTKQNSIITGLLTEIKQLKLKNMEQEKQIVMLENRVSDLEQYSRINDIILSGLAVRPKTYLHAVKGTGSEDSTEHEEILTVAILRLAIHCQLGRGKASLLYMP